jgi:hypothetical protein
VSACPGNLTASLNGTSCVTQVERALQTNSSIYFPYSIATILGLVLIVLAKIYAEGTKLVRAMAGVLGPVMVLCWVTSAAVLVVNRAQVEIAAVPGILVLAGLGLHLLTNLGSLLYARNHLLGLKSL